MYFIPRVSFVPAKEAVPLLGGTKTTLQEMTRPRCNKQFRPTSRQSHAKASRQKIIISMPIPKQDI